MSVTTASRTTEVTQKKARYTTGRLAQKAGVNLQTIRYYERSGLLPAPERDESGYRQYDESSLSRLKFIKKAQALGFSLKEIGMLLELRSNEGKTCADVKAMATKRMQEVRTKISDLEKVHSFMENFSSDCEDGRSAPDCSFLEAIDRAENLMHLQAN